MAAQKVAFIASPPKSHPRIAPNVLSLPMRAAGACAEAPTDVLDAVVLQLRNFFIRIVKPIVDYTVDDLNRVKHIHK